jgi:tetratricopeptide (TPR) repeat protein
VDDEFCQRDWQGCGGCGDQAGDGDIVKRKRADIVMGKKTKISGQAGAAGDNAHVHDNTFNQTVINQAAPITYTALHQLPPPPADFVGRKKEMRELLKALEKQGVTISGLQGMGGIGKTALALKLAEQLKSKYPDAQFYLDLKGASNEPLSAAQVMAHVIRAYHPESKLPDNESGLRACYLSLLEGKKALLLMDNASSREQVKPLIPPVGSIMLITSRNHFTLSGFFVKNLDTLGPKDAKRLLLRIAPRVGDCAEKIVQLCGYLPLALEVAASAMQEFINLTPREYLQLLSDATERLELVEASLSLSYELLSEEQQKLWRVLSVFPNTFDNDAVAALWEMNVENAKLKLAKLISYSLIEWNETTRRYRLHDLVRLFADARLTEQERLATKKSHATYFQDLLEQADKLYLKGREETIQGLALFDKERENIEAGQRWSASQISIDIPATELSMGYYFSEVNVLALRLHPREQINWLEVSLKFARLLKYKQIECVALGRIGSAYKNLGETRKAIEYYQQSLEIAREIGDRRSEGIGLGSLGVVYKNLGETRKAIEFHQQNLEIAREIGDRRSEGNALGNLGIAFWHLGETSKAIEYHQQNLEIASEIGDRRGESNALGNLGNAYADLGETCKAIEFSQQNLEIAREIGDRRGESNALGRLGSAYADLGEFHKAIEYHQQALQIAREVSNRRNEGNTLGSLGIVYKNLGETLKAIELHQQNLEIAREIGDRRGESNALSNLGGAYVDLGESHKAIVFCEQTLIIAQEIGNRLSEGNAYWNAALAYNQLEDHTQAILFAEKAQTILEQIDSPDISKVCSTLEKWKSEQV